MDVQPDAISAFLLIGTNDSFPVDPDEEKRSIINLNHLPTLFHPFGLEVNLSHSDSSQWISPLSTVLVCDPQLELSGGWGQLTPGKNLTVAASGLPLVGNISPDVTTTIFSQVMLDVLDADNPIEATWVGDISVRLFLTDISENFTAFPHGVPIYNLPTLNENFNIFTSSASKAFSDGFFVNPSNRSDITIRTRSVVGLGEVEKPALVGDKTLGLVSLCLSIAAAVGFGVLVRLLNANPGATFELQNIMKALQAGE